MALEDAQEVDIADEGLPEMARQLAAAKSGLSVGNEAHDLVLLRMIFYFWPY